MSKEQLLYEAIENGCFSEVKRLLQNKTDYDIVNKEYNKKYPLCWACENNNYDIVDLLIKQGAEVNKLDLYSQSALAYAVESADLEVVKLLVKSGADINTSDINGVYPLHVAINRKDDEICDYLINEGAFINVADKEGCSILSLAIINDYVYMVYKLLKLGADPNVVDYNGDSPLIKAIWSTSSNLGSEQVLKICKTLVEYGADINIRNENGRTALFTAIYENNTDVALFLIENGANFNLDDYESNSNFTLLHYACYQGNYVLAKVLLEKNCDPNCMSSSGESPIYIATTKGYLNIVELLIDYGSDVNVIFGHLAVNRCTLLQATVYYIKDYKVFKSIVDKLINAKINLGVSDPVAILNVCLQYNKIDFAKYLLMNGAPIEVNSHIYQSTFYKAFLMKNIEIMELCILSGFSLNKMIPWVEEYLEYPNIEEERNSHNYRLINMYRNNHMENDSDTEVVESGEDDLDDINSLMRKSDEEIAEMLAIDEFFLEKLHHKQQKQKLKVNSKKKEIELARNIYSMIKHYYMNPLSLQELARIQIRKSLIKVDYTIKNKIENKMYLPNRIKNYLLFKDICKF